jgi:putative transcriptional regulator
MIPSHHPSEDLISSFAAGTLRPGASLVVRAHLAKCAACRAEAAFFECVGGALMEVEHPAELAPDALATALKAINRPEAAAADAAPRSTLLSGLSGLTLGKRRWVAPGVWVTPVKTNRRSRELVYILRIGAGMVLPRHTHTGCEFTCVLEGGFSDPRGHYDPGDFIAADETVEHSPIVAHDSACICLAATDAPLVMRTLVGRFFQPLAGI